MQHHAESTWISTVIKPKVKTAGALESTCVMAPNGA
jgi:hypothetical protein